MWCGVERLEGEIAEHRHTWSVNFRCSWMGTSAGAARFGGANKAIERSTTAFVAADAEAGQHEPKARIFSVAPAPLFSLPTESKWSE